MSASVHKALRPIALFEACKGGVVLLAGFGLLSFLGRNAEHFAERLVHRAHLNPAHHYPRIFIDAMAQVNDRQLWLLAGLAAVYATVRFVEAYGLWWERRWAEWLAALSGAIYVPIEIYEIMHHVTWLKVVTLALNLAVVLYMVKVLRSHRRSAAKT